ncbi:sugar kinase [Streptomyces brevispora]|uniref:sugar kinase n=1 Tax=Streptomyces brevispora TaxID=887462 RepID=UPI00372243DA
MTPPDASAVAIDAGSRFLRVARVEADGTPRLVDLPGAVPGEGLPTPAAACGDRDTALRLAYAAYREHFGTPDRLVLVVPQPEQDRPAPDVGVPRPRLLGTPHAVLALLRRAGGPPAWPLLVCDLGASGIGITRCALVGRMVGVSRVTRYEPGSPGYGAAFDAAVLDGAGIAVEEPDVLRGLALARAANARRIEAALDRMALRPDRAERFADTVVYEVAGREITAGVVYQALSRLTDGLDRALAEARPGPDRLHVIAVGGPARSGALIRHLTERMGPAAPLPDGIDPASAAVLGAALVAAGRADSADRYPYAVAVRVHRTVAGRPRDGELLISPPGTLVPGGATVFAEDRGEQVRLSTAPAAGGGDREVQLVVRDTGAGTAVPAGTAMVPAIADARLHVGLRITTDGTARLVLRPLGRSPDDAHPPQRPPTEIPLGALPVDARPAETDRPPDTRGVRT